MKTQSRIVAAAGLLLAAHAALAFSPIWNINCWNPQRLAGVGITVTPWEHEWLGEDPPLEWVRVSFDCSRCPQDQEVVMTLWVTRDGETVCTARATRADAAGDAVALIVAVRPEHREGARVQILLPKADPDGGHYLTGYALSMNRLLELARQPDGNGDDGD